MVRPASKGQGAMRKQAGAKRREPPSEEEKAEEDRRREVQEVQELARDLVRRLSQVRKKGI